MMAPEEKVALSSVKATRGKRVKNEMKGGTGAVVKDGGPSRRSAGRVRGSSRRENLCKIAIWSKSGVRPTPLMAVTSSGEVW